MALLPFINSTSHKERRLQVLIGRGMVVKIQLDEENRELTSGFQRIGGTVELHKNETMSMYSIDWNFVFFRVQLEGVATGVSVISKQQLQKQERVDRFLFPEGNAGSPVSHLAYYVIKPNDPQEKRNLQAGFYSFPFEIKLKGENFPADYSGPYGRIEYNLVAYVGLKGAPVVEAAQETLKTKGYLNLALDPALNQRLTLSKKKEFFRGFFSSTMGRLSTASSSFLPTSSGGASSSSGSTSNSTSGGGYLQIRIILNKRGFLPLETLTCTLQVDNPTQDKIKRLSITFIQRIVNCVSPMKRFTNSPLEHRSIDCDTTDMKIQWDSQITIPADLIPTFTRDRRTIEILYFLQFEVETETCANGNVQNKNCKGETMIIIGTTRRNEDVIEAGRAKLKIKSASGSSLSQLSSLSSLSFASLKLAEALGTSWDCVSVESFRTAPPTYSSLARSASISTLPPTYTEVKATK